MPQAWNEYSSYRDVPILNQWMITKSIPILYSDGQSFPQLPDQHDWRQESAYSWTKVSGHVQWECSIGEFIPNEYWPSAMYCGTRIYDQNDPLYEPASFYCYWISSLELFRHHEADRIGYDSTDIISASANLTVGEHEMLYEYDDYDTMTSAASTSTLNIPVAIELAGMRYSQYSSNTTWLPVPITSETIPANIDQNTTQKIDVTGYCKSYVASLTSTANYPCYGRYLRPAGQEFQPDPNMVNVPQMMESLLNATHKDTRTYTYYPPAERWIVSGGRLDAWFTRLDTMSLGQIYVNHKFSSLPGYAPESIILVNS